MLRYRETLKSKARILRRDLTEAEKVLWNRLRMKQVQGIQFFRQRPIGNYIVDFFAPRARLVIELDGSQHLTDSGMKRDRKRDEYLNRQGFLVLHFNDSDVLKETTGVLEIILRRVSERVKSEIPPPPL